MPARKPDPDFYQEVRWIEGLPNNGGEWGKGVVNTVRELQESMQRMKAQKAELDAMIAGHRKLLRSTVSKAKKDSTMLFSNSQIGEAAKQLIESLDSEE